MRLHFLLLFLCLASVAAAGEVCGSVRDERTDAPIHGAGIFLYQDHTYTGLHTATEPDGTFCIESVPAGTYDLLVAVEDYTQSWLAGVIVTDTPTSVEIALGTRLLRFDTPWPNPSSDLVNFRFALSQSAFVNVDIFDVRGRRVFGWFGESEGERTLLWNYETAAGLPVPTGVYFVRISAEGISETRSFVRIR